MAEPSLLIAMSAGRARVTKRFCGTQPCSHYKKDVIFIPIYYEPATLRYAKELRRSMTRQEANLWYKFLSSYQPRFQRQKPVDVYIVDFYCHRARLVVELDGSQHYEEEGMRYDEQRTRKLEQYGLEIMRFSNLDVDRNFRGVCEAIDRKVQLKSDEV